MYKLAQISKQIANKMPFSSVFKIFYSPAISTPMVRIA